MTAFILQLLAVIKCDNPVLWVYISLQYRNVYFVAFILCVNILSLA